MIRGHQEAEADSQADSQQEQETEKRFREGEGVFTQLLHIQSRIGSTTVALAKLSKGCHDNNLEKVLLGVSRIFPLKAYPHVMSRVCNAQRF